ncbi:ATP-binding protein [Pseudomonas sp. KCJK9016]|uniref:ATP-binding protein n=1 Tax=Pseudomonas sp. KCJK9016 TaxID=3344556 RepID=UPI0039063182
MTFDNATQAWLSDRSSIRVAFWGGAHPPLYMGFERDTFEGVVADTLGLLQQMLGLPVRMLHYPTRDDALRGMAKGEVDMLALGAADDEPSPLFNGSKPYLLNRKVLVRRIDHSEKTTDVLSGDRIAYIAHTEAMGNRVRAQYPNNTLVPYTDYLNAMAGLAYEQADVLRIDAIAAEFLISRFYRNELYFAGDASRPGAADLNFAVSVRAPQLLEAINQSLAAIPVASMLRITSRWGLNNNFVVARPSLNLSSEQVEWIANHKTLKVGVSNSYAPLTFFDETNQLQGLSAELLKRIGQMTGLSFEIVRTGGVDEMVEQLQDRKIDFIAALSVGGGMFPASRISRAYLVSPFVVVTRHSDAERHSLEELNGLRLALAWGNPLSPWLTKNYPKVDQVIVRNATQGIEMLAEKEVEGAVTPQISADYFITQHFRADLHITSVIGPSPAAIAMAVAPGNETLKGIIDAALLAIPPEEMKDMTDRWRNNAAPAVASPWNTYKDVVVQVVAGSALLVLLFLVWIRYLRVQIRKRQKAERALQDQLEFSRTLIDGAPVALYVRDSEGRLAHCNQAYLDFFEMSREELIGKTLVESQVFSAEFSERYHHTYLDTLENGQSIFTDMDVEVRGQQYRVYHWILPFLNFNGQYIGVIGGWLDITEREHLIEQLRLAKETATEANRSKSVFLASMSHEIRTPVSALVGLIELLRLKGASAADMDENLQVAHQSAQSLLSLIGDILDLSKIEAGEMTLAPRPTHLEDQAQSIYRLFETNARSKNLEYRLVTEVHHPGVMIDALIFNQVVANLLSNAIKFTDQGSVQLILRELPGELPAGRARFAIQVSDTGRGLSETQRQEIFEPFVQADPHSNRAVGTGLGLSICASLAKLMGAQLTVDSQLGLGSRFTLIFDADLVEVEQSNSLPIVEASFGHKLKILVVEDHAPNRLLLCRQLEYLGHEAWPCDDGESAFAQWKSAEPPFDLTITDCNMPRVDGYQLSCRMREEEQQQGVRAHPIFGLTASAQPEIIERCLEAGMTRCLFKPLGVEALTLSLAQVQQTSKRRAQAATSGGSELDKIRLLSPESFEPLVQEILQTHRDDRRSLERLMLENNHDALAHVAHKIKGGAQLVGDQTLHEACQRLEQLVVEEAEPAQYRKQVEAILSCLLALEVRLLEQLRA